MVRFSLQHPRAAHFVTKAQRGFTVIELLVVCAIMVAVTGILLANNTEYGGQVLLQNFAYDVALSVRQAQVYGISVQRFGAGGSSTFTAGYGIHFTMSTPTNYELFADANTPPDGLYECTTPGAADCEQVSATTITRGYHISDLCYTSSGGSESCYSTAGTPQSLDIVFERPEPDALITACGASGCASSCLTNGSLCEASARIELESPRGDTMSVSVEANGQIAVDQKITQ
jgi:prepilin-type N-terminal cleavage/methylation domain-containing protein